MERIIRNPERFFIRTAQREQRRNIAQRMAERGERKGLDVVARMDTVDKLFKTANLQAKIAYVEQHKTDEGFEKPFTDAYVSATVIKGSNQLLKKAGYMNKYGVGFKKD